MGFGFKKFRWSSCRDIPKSAKSQDLEYSCPQTGFEKADWLLRSQERKYTKLSQDRNMMFGNILTLRKINLSYFELFYEIIYHGY